MKNILVYEFFLNNDVSADEYIINEACFMVNFLLNFYFIPLDLGQQFYLPDIYSFGLVSSLIITVIFIAIYAYLFASSSRKISNALSISKLQILNQKKTGIRIEISKLKKGWAFDEINNINNTYYSSEFEFVNVPFLMSTYFGKKNLNINFALDE